MLALTVVQNERATIDSVPSATTSKSGASLPLTGGQSLGPMLNLRLARPSLLVDVSRLEALARVEDIGRACERPPDRQLGERSQRIASLREGESRLEEARG